MSGSETWVKTVATDAVEGNDGVLGTRAGKCQIAIYAVDGTFYATDDICSHGFASLADGYLDGHQIECPLHQGTFDVRTGEATGAPCTIAIRAFPVRIEEGAVYVQLRDGDV